MIESKQSTGNQDGGPSFCTPTRILSGNHSGAKILVKYDIHESLDIKEEIFPDEEVHQQGKHNLHSGKNPSDRKCITTETSSDNNSGANASGEYDFFEVSDIKPEIVQNKEGHHWGNQNLLSGENQCNEKCISTEISSKNNFGAMTLIKYDPDETLEIKEEIIQDPERHYDETLEIKEENMLDQESIEQELDGQYKSKLCITNTREADIMTVKGPRNSRKEKLHESKGEPKKKYNCEKCARSYSRRKGLNAHKKFECGVIPHFRCGFCGKQFKRKGDMNRHIIGVHEKTNSKASQMKHNCEKCPRGYSSLSALNIHEREEHAVVKPQFICDYCGFETTQKCYLSKHITSRHFEKFHVSITEREKKYNCEKCARTYVRKQSLIRHKKFECGVVPQFSCEFCGKSFKLKGHMNRHTLRVHEKAGSKASQTRHNCNKCSRSYSSSTALNVHKRAEHAVIKPQFICDYCGFQTKRKSYLSKHITSQHLNL